METAHSVADPLSETKLAAAGFATAWGQKASSIELSALHADQPKIPKLLDVDLIQAVEHHMGVSLRGNDGLKRAARLEFWRSVPANPPQATAP